MRNSPFSLTAIVFALLVASCGRPTDPIEDNHGFSPLYGTWVWAGYEERATVLRRSSELDDNLYGLIIRPRGKLTERKSAGWCGTPPIIYANYEGEWKALSRKLLEITVGYWGGTTSYHMEIVSRSPEELKIVYHYDN
jgi:hypothetical protein